MWTFARLYAIFTATIGALAMAYIAYVNWLFALVIR